MSLGFSTKQIGVIVAIVLVTLFIAHKSGQGARVGLAS